MPNKIIGLLYRQILPLLTIAVALPSGSVTAREGPKQPFLMLISIDGLKPEAILDAEHFGLRVPNLRAFS